MLALAGCAASPEPAPDPRFGARRALVEAAERGPVLAEIYGNAPLADGAEAAFADLPATFARGVRGLDVAFTDDRAEAAVTDPRLVVVVDPALSVATSDLCRAPDAIPIDRQQGQAGLIAAFCSGDEVIGGGSRDQVSLASGRNARDRMVWRVANDLFPDDYESTFGINLIPGIDIGIGGSVGF